MLLQMAAVDQQRLWTTHDNRESRHKPWKRFIFAESGSRELSRNRSTSPLSLPSGGQCRLRFYKRQPEVATLTARVSIRSALNCVSVGAKKCTILAGEKRRWIGLR